MSVTESTRDRSFLLVWQVNGHWVQYALTNALSPRLLRCNALIRCALQLLPLQSNTAKTASE